MHDGRWGTAALICAFFLSGCHSPATSAGAGEEGAEGLEGLAARLGVDELHVVEGDVLVSDLERFASSEGFYGMPNPERPKLVAHQDPDDPWHMVHWDEADRWRLTYCIENEWGEWGKQRVIDAMAVAAAAWEDEIGVEFVYRPEQDYRCRRAKDDVTFRVIWEPTLSLLFRAAAFLPNERPAGRSLVITATALDPYFLEPNQNGYTTERILAHELGHVLGFRHEHIREGSECTDESDDWFPLTVLDRNSIMYYPSCNPGYDSSGGILTPVDAAGARYVYRDDPDPTAGCGDGFVTGLEACDDGNDVSGDGCREGCLVIEEGWECPSPGQPCVLPSCGDGVLDPGERCDDGNTIGGDGCPAACACPPFDVDNRDASFCADPDCPCEDGMGDCDFDSDCVEGTVCGHDIGDMFGLPSGWDLCVVSGATNPNACPGFSADDPSPTFCNYPGCKCAEGEGDCDRHSDCAPGLACGRDNGPAFGLPAGWDVCVPPVCGNGIVEPGEQCDDGNSTSGDGCSSGCLRELIIIGGIGGIRL